MKLLAVECTATPASVAITEDGKLISEFYCNVGLTHSATLMPMIDDILKFSGTDINDIDGYCISAGPGSFTGVRIGISTVKGLAAPKDTPCVGVSTLEAMAEGKSDFDGIVATVMDARCNQCYCALFISKNGKVDRISPDMALSMEEFCGKIVEESAKYDKGCILVGDGSKLIFDSFCNNLSQIRLSKYSNRYQSARYVAQAAEKYFISGETVSPQALLPIYLRLPQAQRELKKKTEAIK